MTTSNRRHSKENAQVGDGDHATDEVRNNDVASELRSPQAGSPQGGRNPPKGTAKAQKNEHTRVTQGAAQRRSAQTKAGDAKTGRSRCQTSHTQEPQNNLEHTGDMRSDIIGRKFTQAATVWLGDIELHICVGYTTIIFY